ncbi:class II fructose-bisphosphate aldolase [Patescibacteria group bacterium AH-259-L05]|nr:class II fructose-bisphosphate aldolase [Patescibacteria group bacterium AH-259-L05]
MLVHIKDLVKKTEKGKYALGAFNTFNLEITLGIVKGAMEAQAPIIIQISETTLNYAGVKAITHIVKTIAKNQANNIPIALHLDHGKSFSAVMECVKAGFSSIMIDASNLPFDENITVTQKSVQYAHRHGVWAQGELGKIVKEKKEIEHLVQHPEKFLTDPDQAQEFVKKTKIDALAVSVGNVHGVYKLEHKAPVLDLKRLAEIGKKVDVPLVLHGASKIPADSLKKAIKLGVRIINIDTETRHAFKQSLLQSLKKRGEYDPRKFLSPTIDAVAKVIKEKIIMFGSAGKV